MSSFNDVPNDNVGGGEDRLIGSLVLVGGGGFRDVGPSSLMARSIVNDVGGAFRDLACSEAIPFSSSLIGGDSKSIVLRLREDVLLPPVDGLVGVPWGPSGDVVEYIEDRSPPHDIERPCCNGVVPLLLLGKDATDTDLL